MADPLFSVIIASYQHARFIAEAIDSVLQQSCDDLELLIIDDGSTDGSWEIIAGKAQSDVRIRATRQDNRGLSPTLNTLVSKCRGKYVTWLGSDDAFMPERLHWARVDIKEHPEAMAVFCWADTVDAQGGDVKEGSPNFHLDNARGTLARQMLSGNRLCSCAGAIRRDILTRGPQAFANLAYYQDYELWLRLLAQGELYVRPEVGVRYRVHADNLSRVSPKTQRTHLQEMAFCLQLHGPKVIERHAGCLHELGPLYGRLGTLYYMLGDYGKAAQYFGLHTEIGQLSEEGALLHVSALFNLRLTQQANQKLAQLLDKRDTLSMTGQAQLDQLVTFSHTAAQVTRA